MKFDLPTVVLVVLLLGFIYTVWTVSHSTRVNFADMFKGPDGLASATRFMALGAWVFGSWVLIKTVQEGNFSNEYALGYLGIFVGGYALNKASESFATRAPPKVKKGT